MQKIARTAEMSTRVTGYFFARPVRSYMHKNVVYVQTPVQNVYVIRTIKNTRHALYTAT